MREPDFPVIILACILMVGLLYCENRGYLLGKLLFKSPLSFLFVIVALFQPHPFPRYADFVIAGLLWCVVGDIFLVLPGARAFLAGLSAFLMGHVFYVMAFFSATDIESRTWIAVPMIVLVSGTIYFRLRPHLENMKMPVLAYVIVISLMMLGAVSLSGNGALALRGRGLALTGALGFYLSDLFVARDHFIKREYINRLIGLPLYYLGQFLLSFSVGLL